MPASQLFERFESSLYLFVKGHPLFFVSFNTFPTLNLSDIIRFNDWHREMSRTWSSDEERKVEA